MRLREEGLLGNTNEPTRLQSPGDDGSVSQANVAKSNANAEPECGEAGRVRDGCDSMPVHEADGASDWQLDKSNQLAGSLALVLQLDPKNGSSPERDKSPGTGDLHQVGKKVGSDGE